VSVSVSLLMSVSSISLLVAHLTEKRDEARAGPFSASRKRTDCVPVAVLVVAVLVADVIVLDVVAAANALDLVNVSAVASAAACVPLDTVSAVAVTVPLVVAVVVLAA
jgi:hypothetical protein